MKKYFTYNGTEQAGPFDVEELQNQNVSKETLIWTDGMKDWKKAGEISEVKNILFHDKIGTKAPVENILTADDQKPQNGSLKKINREPELQQQPVRNEAISVGDWMITMLLTFIPLVGIIMLFVWAFSGGTPASKANWAKAYLIWVAIAISIWLLIFLFFGFGILSALNAS